MTTYDLHRPFLTEVSPTIAAADTLRVVDPPVVQTLEAIAPQPTLRIRIEHSRTIKDGWSYSTTIEIDGVDATSYQQIREARELLTATLIDVRMRGEQERDLRNERDAALKQATPAPAAS